MSFLTEEKIEFLDSFWKVDFVTRHSDSCWYVLWGIIGPEHLEEGFTP